MKNFFFFNNFNYMLFLYKNYRLDENILTRQLFASMQCDDYKHKLPRGFLLFDNMEKIYFVIG